MGRRSPVESARRSKRHATASGSRWPSTRTTFSFPTAGARCSTCWTAPSRGASMSGCSIWRPNAETRPSPRMFGGSAEQRALLARRGSRFKIRWDRAATVFCQHQKSWVIDAGQPSETAFVGGLNLTVVAMQRHDVYAEVTGPSATDVHHNFAQRWNEASEREAPDGNWACDSTDTLPLPERPSRPAGPSVVQIQRMQDPNRYPAHRVERSILEQYERAIDAARRTIYIENQAVPIPQVARRLLGALERGVAVVLLVPAIPEPYVYEARLDPAGRRVVQRPGGARPSPELHACRHRRAARRGPSRGLCPCQDDAGRRCLGHGRLVQSARLFPGREFGDERIDLGRGGHTRPCAARCSPSTSAWIRLAWTTARRSACSRTSPAAIVSKWKGASPTGKAWLSPCRRKPTPENRV